MSRYCLTIQGLVSQLREHPPVSPGSSPASELCRRTARQRRPPGDTPRTQARCSHLSPSRSSRSASRTTGPGWLPVLTPRRSRPESQSGAESLELAVVVVVPVVGGAVEGVVVGATEFVDEDGAGMTYRPRAMPPPAIMALSNTAANSRMPTSLLCPQCRVARRYIRPPHSQRPPGLDRAAPTGSQPETARVSRPRTFPIARPWLACDCRSGVPPTVGWRAARRAPSAASSPRIRGRGRPRGRRGNAPTVPGRRGRGSTPARDRSGRMFPVTASGAGGEGWLT